MTVCADVCARRCANDDVQVCESLCMHKNMCLDVYVNNLSVSSKIQILYLQCRKRAISCINF